MTSDLTTFPRSSDGGPAAAGGGSQDLPPARRPVGPARDRERPVPDLLAVTCRPMPFPAYLAAPADLRRAEYVQGWTVMREVPTARHRETCQRLLRLL